MRAAVSPAPVRLEIVDHPEPELGPRDVLVRLDWASINPVDGQTLAGVYTELGWVTQSGPIGLGWDGAGTVVAVGSAVSDRQEGQRVAVFSVGVDKPLGTFAERIAVDAASTAVVPDALDLRDAATIPLNGLTSWQALDLLGEPRGTLVITGAAGAVGGFATVLATRRGWRVLGLARPTDRETVESSGAELITAMPEQPVEAMLDAAVIGEGALDVIVDGGAYVGVVPPAVPPSVRGIWTTAVSVGPDEQMLREIVALVSDGVLAIRHAGSYPFAEIDAAMAAASEPGRRGRTTLDLR